jgi:two-component system, chemotaxis family, sensor kinase CheA
MSNAPGFHELIERLRSFTPGDLVGCIDIMEEADALTQKSGLGEDAAKLLQQISDFFQFLVKEGGGEEAADTAADFAEKLDALVPAEELEEGKKRQTETEHDDSDYEVLSSFIQEAQDHLENIEEEILKLEDGNDPVVVNNIFRSMHTIKGVASFIGLNKIKNLSHSLESVLDKLRENKLAISDELVDLLLAGTDLLTKMVHELDAKAHAFRESGKSGTLDSEMDIDQINDALEHVLEEETSPVEHEAPEKTVSPAMVSQFTEDTLGLLEEVEEALNRLEQNPEEKKPASDAFRLMHTIKGNAGFLGFQTIEHVCLNIETVLDQIHREMQDYNEKISAILFDSIQAVRQSIEKIQQGGEAPDEFVEQLIGGTEEETESSPIIIKPLGEALVEAGVTSKAAVEKALEMQQRRLGEILIDSGKVKPEQLERALSTQKQYKGEARAEAAKTTRKDIRVDTEKLDKLFDLMGELITTEAMVIDNPDLEQYELENFYIASNYLSKITREMQEITMAIRMIPLEGLFNKMRRLVRDLSRKFKKKVDLDISGQDTEMDRNVLEEISDPLVHIIRNAIDHGIETPEERAKAGKDETGHIWLNARYEGNENWISVKDDGRGLDRERILRKAETAGLLKTEPASMKDREVWDLLFEPGFSTAETVSEVSGRGVGMDVVKKNIEKLRGKVDVFTTRGKGTEIILRIPLTLAIIDGISFKVADKLYSIPINDIISFHKVTEDQVTTTKENNEVLNLRNELFPILKLYQVYNIDTDKTKISDGIILIVNVDNKKAALLVDEIIGFKQLVVKALPESMGELEGISGCSIMGSGEVSLIMDTNTLLQRVLD